MKKSKELRAMARAQLNGSWLAAVIVILIFSVIISASGFLVVGPFIIGGPLILGLTGYFLKKARGEQVELENLFDGFKLFSKSFLVYLLYIIFVTLWSFLLIIPGIIKSFSYSMAFFILKDNPEIGAMEAITRSKQMMAGNKWRLFCLCFSFIGWIILACFTFGIAFLWLIPYMYQSYANFYEELRKS